jgi:hypothetical protein
VPRVETALLSFGELRVLDAVLVVPKLRCGQLLTREGTQLLVAVLGVEVGRRHRAP